VRGETKGVTSEGCLLPVSWARAKSTWETQRLTPPLAYAEVIVQVLVGQGNDKPLFFRNVLRNIEMFSACVGIYICICTSV